MHTTNCVQPPSLIGYNVAGEVGKFIAATHIDKVVKMPEIIAQGSLIGAVPEAVSIEVSNADLGEGIFRRLREDIMRYAEGGTLPIARTTYSVVDKLYKKDVSEDVARTMQNFEPLPDGSVPVLVGENSYKRQTDYLGFRAVRVTT